MAGVRDTFDVDMGTYVVHVTRKRVKNFNFRIGANGEARASIPLHVSRADAERVVREHAGWFEQALARSSDRQADVPRRWQTGETIAVWGTPTPLCVVGADDTSVPCELRDGELVVRDGGVTHDAWWREAAVENWLQQQLIARLNELLPSCAEAVGRYPSHITIRRMKTRWGSCTPKTGRIRINTALAECPPECTQTVLVHELCHLRVSNHGPEFKALMHLCCPGWRVSQRWLDEHPPSTR